LRAVHRFGGTGEAPEIRRQDERLHRFDIEALHDFQTLKNEIIETIYHVVSK
jgi:hypothetical protein